MSTKAPRDQAQPDEGQPTRPRRDANVTDTMREQMCEALGGAMGVRALTDAVVDRMVGDVMIGFLFRHTDVARLKAHEFAHAAAWLRLSEAGQPVQYKGRDLTVAHQRHRITGGQFDRRMVLVRQVLEARDLPAPIIDAWCAHHEALRGRIVHRKVHQR